MFLQHIFQNSALSILFFRDIWIVQDEIPRTPAAVWINYIPLCLLSWSSATYAAPFLRNM